MALFTRRNGGARQLRKRLDADMGKLSRLAERYNGKAADGSFDLLPFTIRAFELQSTSDIEYLIAHDSDGSEFFLRELKPNWRDLSREQREAKIASFVRFANLLDRSDENSATASEESVAVTEALAELRAAVRTKVVLLAAAYDAEYDDSYGRRIARNPRRFGDLKLAEEPARA